MSTSQPLHPAIVKRLQRFLHVGLETPKYFPGSWMSHQYFEQTKAKVLDEVFSNDKNNTEVVGIILKAYQSGYFTRFETIAFTLAKCLHLGSEPAKEATYKTALEVCKSPEEMMMFTNFARQFRTGNGRGWCKFIKKWYLTRDTMQLAKDVTRVRARHGRSHKTLVSKSHMKVDETDHARDAIIKYILLGLQKSKAIVGDKASTVEIFKYITKVEDLRLCEEPIAASKIATDNKFVLDHVPGHLLTSFQVWEAILPQMPLREMLNSIQRLHNLGYLTNDSSTARVLCTQLKNFEKIKASQVTPIEVYITICNYEKKSKPMKYPKAKAAIEKEKRRRLRQTYNDTTQEWEWNVSTRHNKEIKNWGIDKKPCKIVIDALQYLLNKTWVVTKPTKARYLITLDMREHMFKGRHFCKRVGMSNKVRKRNDDRPGPSASTSACPPDATSATPPDAASTSSGRGGGDADRKRPNVNSKRREFAECFYNKHISPGYAAIILMLQLLKREKIVKVKVAVFTDEGIQIIDTRHFTDIEGTARHLQSANLGCVQLDAPIKWASNMKENFDVFINMIDRPTRIMELDLADRAGRGAGGRFHRPPDGVLPDRCPVRALERYRENMSNNAKLIVMSLATHKVFTTNGSHEGVLDLIGVDEYTPKVLDAFVLGHFK